MKAILLKLGLPALVTSIALGALANTALAGPEWLYNGSVIGTPLPVRPSGTLFIEDAKATGGAIRLRCIVALEGFIGSGKNGEFDAAEGGNGERTTVSEPKPFECSFMQRGACEAGATPLMSVLNFPWDTEVILVTAGETDLFRDRINNGGKGAPGFEMECHMLGIKFNDTCTGNTGVSLTNVAGASVEAKFSNENTEVTPLLNCSVGGMGEGYLLNEFGYSFANGEGDIQVSG
jgi:hypothetical protein